MRLQTTPVIRDATLGEQPAIRDLTLTAYAQYAAVLTPSHWDGLRGAITAALDATGPVERIVAVQNDELWGSVMLCPPVDTTSDRALGRMVWPELRLLAVAPAARGQGIGQALVKECLRRTAQTGAEALGLYTSDDLAAAVRLYERMGFVRVPHYDFHTSGGELVKAYRHALPR